MTDLRCFSHAYITKEHNLLTDLQDPLTFGAMEPGPQQPSLQHRIEKIHLMKKLERKAAKWNSNHPRYRLLEALYGYARYRERSMAELNRWRNKYSKLPKRQRKVSEIAYIILLYLTSFRPWNPSLSTKINLIR